MKLQSTVMRFMDGRRVRPGETFDWPDDKPAPKGSAPAEVAPAPVAAAEGEPRTMSEIGRREAKDHARKVPKGSAAA